MDEAGRARNLTDGVDGVLTRKRHTFHDRDPLFADEFRGVLAAVDVTCLRPHVRNPNLKSIRAVDQVRVRQTDSGIDHGTARSRQSR